MGKSTTKIEYLSNDKTFKEVYSPDNEPGYLVPMGAYSSGVAFKTMFNGFPALVRFELYNNVGTLVAYTGKVTPNVTGDWLGLNLYSVDGTQISDHQTRVNVEGDTVTLVCEVSGLGSFGVNMRVYSSFPGSNSTLNGQAVPINTNKVLEYKPQFRAFIYDAQGQVVGYTSVISAGEQSMFNPLNNDEEIRAYSATISYSDTGFVCYVSMNPERNYTAKLQPVASVPFLAMKEGTTPIKGIDFSISGDGTLNITTME